MNTKLIKIFKALKVVVCTYILFASLPVKANDSITLMLDWFVNPNHGPIIIAKQQGYFEQQGLDVTIQEPADPSVPAKMVAAGKADLAISYQASLTIDVAQGLPLYRSGTLIDSPLNTLITLKSSGIDSLEKLKGKTIGISVADNEKAAIGTMLNQVGLKFSDIKIVNVGWALSASLASKRVDAIWGGMRNFEVNQLALENQDVNLFNPEDYGVPNYDELVFVANANTASAATIDKFNQAIAKGAQYIKAHPDKAWQSFIDYAPDTLNTPLNKLAWKDTLAHFSLDPAKADQARYQNLSDFMLKHKMISQPVSAAQLLTPKQ